MGNDTLTLTLEKPVAGGRSLARHEGRVVLVSGGIPGERVRVSMERTGKGVAFARVIDVDMPSDDRIAPAGDPRCGGLAFAHVAYPRQLTLKRQIVEDALARIGRLRDLPPVDAVASPLTGWRMRARLHAHGSRVGFFLEGTHTLCDAAPSGQLAPGALELAQRVVDALGADAARAVDAVLVTQTVTGEQQAVHLELQRPLPRRDDLLGTMPAAPSSEGECMGVSAALTTSRRPVTLAGRPWVRESLDALGVPGTGGVHLERHAASFFQGNRVLLPRLVRHVLDSAGAAGPLVDLYAGVGLFGLAAVAAGAESVVAVEGDPVSAEDLATNAAPFGARARVVRGDVESFARDESSGLADACVVVDPPRTGLSPVVAGAVAAATPRRIVYVSCDPATLARDLQTLTTGGLRVAALTVFDLFPVTAHVETVAVLER